MGMAEFQVHAAAHILEFEHGASPGGTGDSNLHRLGTELGMAGQESFASSEKHSGIAVMHGLDLKNCVWRKIVQENATFNFRLDDPAVDFIRQVGVGVKHTDDREIGYPVSETSTRAPEGWLGSVEHDL